MTPSAPLLSPCDPPPVWIARPEGASPFLLTCDHAGREIPARLGRLGLAEAELDRHIAYDLGIAAVSIRLAELLDAVLIGQPYSRLLIDCNRPPAMSSSIPEVSDDAVIPGNLQLASPERHARISEIFRPYHRAIEAEIDNRARGRRQTVLVAMHSFTPIYQRIARPWHVGTLYGRDDRLARTLHRLLVAEGRFEVGDNQPYAVTDATDYTIPVHGEARGLVHAGIEIRQDLISELGGQAEWAETLARLLPQALRAAERERPRA